MNPMLTTHMTFQIWIYDPNSPVNIFGITVLEKYFNNAAEGPDAVEAEFWELAVRVIEVMDMLAMVPLEMRATATRKGGAPIIFLYSIWAFCCIVEVLLQNCNSNNVNW